MCKLLKKGESLNLLEELPTPNSPRKGWAFSEQVSAEKYNSCENLPKITIITPSYNQGEFIEETIRSILLQNYPNLEYIIIDGGSTDSTIEIIKKYEKWITYWVSESDKGQTHAINKGLEKATGEIFNWINSDDFLEKDALFHIASNYQKETQVYCGFCRNISLDYKEDSRKASRLLSSEKETFAQLPFLLHQPGTFFRTEIAKQFSMNIALHYTMDLELWIKYLVNTRQGLNICEINEVFSNLRVYNTSKTGQTDANNFFWTDIYYIYAAWADCFGQEKLAENIRNLSPSKLKENYKFDLKNSDYSKEETLEILHLFIYRMALKVLKYGNKTLTISHFKTINIKYLPKNLRKKYRNLYLGLRFPIINKILDKIK